MAYVELASLDKIKKKLGIEPEGEVQAYLTNTCYRYMDKYVPKDTGILRETVDITPSTITYESPYASYQYYGKRKDKSHKVHNYTTPNTGSYWDRRMVSAEMNDVVDEVKNYMRSRNV